jgi:hypothetical protein
MSLKVRTHDSLSPVFQACPRVRLVVKYLFCPMTSLRFVVRLNLRFQGTGTNIPLTLPDLAGLGQGGAVLGLEVLPPRME